MHKTTVDADHFCGDFSQIRILVVEMKRGHDLPHGQLGGQTTHEQTDIEMLKNI